MWLNSDGGDLIQMDTASIRVGAAQLVNQAVRAADTMGVHFGDLMDPAYCVCDTWDSSVPAFNEEAYALGNEVTQALMGFLSPTVDALTRANQLDADQAQIVQIGGGGAPNTSFGGALAQAIVNDSNNRMAATWLGGSTGTSQVDLLLALNSGTVVGGPAGGSAGALLDKMAFDMNTNMNKTWLAPDGTSYAGQDSSGRDLYKDRQGDTGTLNQIHRDKYDDRKYDVD